MTARMPATGCAMSYNRQIQSSSSDMKFTAFIAFHAVVPDAARKNAAVRFIGLQFVLNSNVSLLHSGGCLKRQSLQ